MKTRADIVRAIHLLDSLLNNEVTLAKFPDKDVKANIAGVMWGLNWILEHKQTFGLEKLLKDIEAAQKEPGANPQQSHAE